MVRVVNSHTIGHGGGKLGIVNLLPLMKGAYVYENLFQEWIDNVVNKLFSRTRCCRDFAGIEILLSNVSE